MTLAANSVIAIGASTGGTEAIEFLLTRLPRTVVGIVIVQHMPPRFTSLFAKRLNQLCTIEVREARHGDRIKHGLALIAPGGQQMRVEHHGHELTVAVTNDPPVNRHKPSVDVLFHSVAAIVGRHALGILLTGMGNDGARGLQAMRHAGAKTIAQEESSCAIFGMPRAAIELGAAEQVCSFEAIARAIAAFK